MQLPIWIIAVSAVMAPVLLGLLLHRLGFSRAVALGLGMALLGLAVLILREPPIDSSLERPAGVASRASDPPPQAETVPPAIARDAIGLAASETSALERERAAHEETRRALLAARTRIATFETERDAPPRVASNDKAELQSARDRLKEAEVRLAIANAEIERLKAAVRAAEPIATAAPLPATPQPFANAAKPETVSPVAAVSPPTEAPPVAAPAATQGSETDGRSASIGRTLANAMRSRSFALVKLAGDELVQGRRGSYYRITCPGTGGAPLTFSAGGYTFGTGYAPLDTCFKAVKRLLIDALPADSERRLYVQGYASQRGFIRPKGLPTRDAHLKSITYLPRIKGRDRFSTAKQRQATGHRFTNAELPNLRGANVAHWIAQASKGAIAPEVLEGELKPGNTADSQSFALLLQVTW